MPDLIIDGLKVSVPEGTNVLQAAERVGVMIPRFCWHPALGSAGSCRMCAVMFTDGPVKGLQMSCMVKARDAMVVDTGHPEALEFRRHVAELLMLHHPHDCPVCDEGGHCLLQDTIISCGHSLREFGGLKRTYVNQDLGPLVAQEMNRCIHCYRCARYYQEFAGGRDFGPRRIAGDVSYSRYRPGALESPFAGNLTQICPTGVFTDKPSRHKARHWDLESAHGVCLHCSLGCNTEPFGRYRSVIKVEARVNPEVNGYFICDRGRHGYEYSNLATRPRQASVDGQEASMDQALAGAAERLGRLRAAYGPRAVAALGSSRQSLESMAALKLLAGAAGWQHPQFTTGAHRKKSLLTAVKASAKDLHVSLGEIANSDCILIAGAAPLSEAPMLALSIRQAVRQGASVMVIDPRPVELPFTFTHVPARKRQIEAAFGAVLHKALAAPGGASQPGSANSAETGGGSEGPLGPAPGETAQAASGFDAAQAAFMAALPSSMPEGVEAPGWEAFAESLGKSIFPVVVCGTDIVSQTTPALAAGAAELLAAARGKAGFFPVLAGANAFGSALMNQEQTSFDDVLEGIEAGRIKALVCVESDPAGRHANHARMQAAIYKLDLLVCIDYLPTATRLQANIFLPSQTVFEAGGSFINNEGRAQHAAPVMAGGTPLNQTVRDGHPPRGFSPLIPGGEPQPARDILAGLAGMLGCGRALAADPCQAVLKCLPELAGFVKAHFAHVAGGGSDAPESAVVLPDAPEVERLAARPSTDRPAEHADIIVTEQAFGTEELSSYGTILKSLAPSPQVVINARDAGAIRLRDEDFIHWACPLGQVNCYSRLVDNMARATVVLPRRPDSGWRHAVADGFTVELKLLSKSAEPPEENDNREAAS